MREQQPSKVGQRLACRTPAGRAATRSEVLRAGWRLIEDQEAEQKARVKALRDATRVGIADMDAGRYRSFDSPDAVGRHLKELAEGALADEFSEIGSK